MIVIRWIIRHWAVIGLSGLAIVWFYAGHKDNLMHERAKFTVGTIYGWYFTPKSGRYFKFEFKVADSSHRNSSPRHALMNEADGARYLVEYDSIDPSVSVAHFDVPIPDSIRAPTNGWRVPPVPVPAWFLDHGKEAK